MEECDLRVTIGKMTLKNPVVVSSGTFGFGEEFEEFFDPGRLGAIITKGISLKPMVGNPPHESLRQKEESSIRLGFKTPGFKNLLRINCLTIKAWKPI